MLMEFRLGGGSDGISWLELVGGIPTPLKIWSLGACVPKKNNGKIRHVPKPPIKPISELLDLSIALSGAPQRHSLLVHAAVEGTASYQAAGLSDQHGSAWQLGPS